MDLLDRLSKLLSGDPIKEDKNKWQYKINSWLGRARQGVWVPEPVSTDLHREYEHHTHGAESTKKKPVIVKAVVRELVYMHHGYRPKFDDEKGTRKSFYFRGARVWRK